MHLKKHIPNFLTILNLVCGIIAIILMFQHRLNYAVYMIFAAAIFDFLDGLTAKLFNIKSPLGKELDALADMVSFGIVPANLLFLLAQTNSFLSIIIYVPFLLTICAALRLARHNTTTTNGIYFLGLPVPANALFWGGYVSYFSCTACTIITNQWFFLVLILLFSYFMISTHQFISFKFIGFSFKENKLRYLFLSISIVLFIFFGIQATIYIIPIYIMLSIK